MLHSSIEKHWRFQQALDGVSNRWPLNTCNMYLLDEKKNKWKGTHDGKRMASDQAAASREAVWVEHSRSNYRRRTSARYHATILMKHRLVSFSSFYPLTNPPHPTRLLHPLRLHPLLRSQMSSPWKKCCVTRLKHRRRRIDDDEEANPHKN